MHPQPVVTPVEESGFDDSYVQIYSTSTRQGVGVRWCYGRKPRKQQRVHQVENYHHGAEITATGSFATLD